MKSRVIRWVIGVLIFAAIFARLSIFTVREGEVAVVTHFGAVKRVIIGQPRVEDGKNISSEAGWYFRTPWPIDRVHTFDARKRVFSPTKTETLTRDQRNIILYPYVIWSISDPKQFLQSLHGTEGAEKAVEDAEAQLSNIVIDAQNAVIGSYNLIPDLVSVNSNQRRIDEIENEVKAAVVDKCARLGITLHQFGFKQLALPESTVKAALDGMKVQRLLEANRYRGDGEKAAREVRSRTQLEVTRIQAEAAKRAAVTLGVAEAEHARILLEAHRTDPDFFAWYRNLEALRKMFTEHTMVILSTKSPPFDVLKQTTVPAHASGAATRPAAGATP